jgi:hypothetical protein
MWRSIWIREINSNTSPINVNLNLHHGSIFKPKHNSVASHQLGIQPFELDVLI